MTNHRILRLPERLDGLHAKQLIDCARDLTEYEEVLLDASAVRFAHPLGVVTLGAALLRRAQKGLSPPSYVAPRDQEAAEFLEEIGFCELLLTGTANDQGTLRVRRLSATSIDPMYIHGVAQLIEERVPQTSESVAYMVEMALNEMVQNSVEHARSTTDVVVLARWYKHGENIRIAIADSGEGIAESLRRNPKYSREQNDRKLVELAVTVEGTTGRVTGRFGGLGLKHLRRLCIGRHGSIHVMSQVVDAHFTLDHNRCTFVPRLAGSAVEIDFRPGPDTGNREEPSSEDFF